MAPGCNNGGKGANQSADSANAANIDSGTVSLNAGETEFMVTAAADGMTEIAMGELAATKTRTSRVKDFADMIVSDHTQAGNELKALAGQKQVTLPDSLSDKSKKDRDKLSAKNGKDFDKAYVDAMVNDHQHAVKMFRDALADVDNPDLRQWITNTLPVLEAHLDSARALDSIYNPMSGKPYPATP